MPLDKKIVILNYGSGNLKSISNGFKKIGENTLVTDKKEEIASADYLILPGVGSFGSAMEHIISFKDLILEHINEGKPFLGICLGLQILFSESEESPKIKGLNIFKGKVKKIPEGRKIPHMGWNSLKVKKNSGILNESNDKFFYFVHSYHGVPEEDIVTATIDYGVELTAAVNINNVYATQFHPEKSGVHGLKILKSFMDL
ncbi:imidazole glycerol phosphate synthase subunit HisH [Methanobrevibacter curvatus]|uniref:Imidazole glycerol phosphate synthase subunit HisH n=1 Tax=Methanobrevibacter curvatus TaxID=49547 RepID=A0A166AQ05_9EURY|nr:imidazole glycerol phosphate synthase subunit HisH [Methanobrevibacter curvatus]KZX12324.1 imidazole glycerol phosphate synthase subunit HisH 1 [Methanobrevibacter curvatus]